MAAGLFGYLGYDMVRLIERLPDDNPDPLGLPDAMLLRPTVVAIFDRIEDEITVVTPVWPSPELSARAAPMPRPASGWPTRCADFDRGRQPRAARGSASPPPRAGGQRQPRATTTRWSSGRRSTSAPATSSRWCPRSASRCRSALPPFALYRALRRLNPSPFLFYLDFGGFRWSGSSPEILVRLRDGKVTIRPIAGTRPRGATPAEDEALAARAAGRPQGARRAPDAARPRPQRRRPRRQDRHRARSPSSSRSSTTATSCTSSPTSRATHPPGLRRARRADGRLPRRHGLAARPRCAPWRSSTSSSRSGAASTPARVGYFAADGTMDTCIALRTGAGQGRHACTSRPAAASSPTATPRPSTRRACNKARALIRAAEEAGPLRQRRRAERRLSRRAAAGSRCRRRR